MLKLSIVAAVISGAAFISGCTTEAGNAAETPVRPGSASEQNSSGDGMLVVKQINGPLDALQAQLSASAFAPLVSVSADTSLADFLHCADELVSQNILDVADSVLVQLEGPHSGGNAAGTADAQQLTQLLGSMAINLTQLLEALGGKGGGCAGHGATLYQIGFDENPLAGTQFEALGSKLGPLLARIASSVEQHDDAEAGDQPLDLERVAELMTGIDHAMQLGLQQVPLAARRTAIIGGALNTVATALTDNSSLIAAVLAQDRAAIGASLQRQIKETLSNSLIQVPPVRAIEAAAGQPDLIGLPIRVSASNYSQLWANHSGTATTPAQSAALDRGLASVFAPFESDLLPVVLTVMGNAIDAGRSAARASGQAPDGMPPDILLSTLEAEIAALFAGGGAECPFATLPLMSGLCRSM